MNKVTISAKTHAIATIFLVLFALFNPLTLALLMLTVFAIDPAAAWHIAVYFADHFEQALLLGLGLVLAILVFKFWELLENL